MARFKEVIEMRAVGYDIYDEDGKKLYDSDWEEMSRAEIRDLACSLYDGDWRASDADEEFRVQWPYLTDWELQVLKEELQAIKDEE